MSTVLDPTFAPKLTKNLEGLGHDENEAEAIVATVAETLAEDPSMIAMVEERRMRTQGD